MLPGAFIYSRNCVFGLLSACHKKAPAQQKKTIVFTVDFLSFSCYILCAGHHQCSGAMLGFKLLQAA